MRSRFCPTSSPTPRPGAGFSEAQTASSLNHPHILTVHDAGEFDGRQYLVTELIDGGTLRDWLLAAPRPWRATVELLTGVADALEVTSDGYAFLPTFSADGTRLYYIVRAPAATQVSRGHLWMTDLASGQRQRLLPDYQVQHYSVSADGRRILFVSAGDKARSGVWLATTDAGAAPRRLAAGDGLQAFFGAAGDVFFAAQEPDGTFVYRVKEDGGQLTRVVPIFRVGVR